MPTKAEIQARKIQLVQQIEAALLEFAKWSFAKPFIDATQQSRKTLRQKFRGHSHQLPQRSREELSKLCGENNWSLTSFSEYMTRYPATLAEAKRLDIAAEDEILISIVSAHKNVIGLLGAICQTDTLHAAPLTIFSTSTESSIPSHFSQFSIATLEATLLTLENQLRNLIDGIYETHLAVSKKHQSEISSTQIQVIGKHLQHLPSALERAKQESEIHKRDDFCARVKSLALKYQRQHQNLGQRHGHHYTAQSVIETTERLQMRYLAETTSGNTEPLNLALLQYLREKSANIQKSGNFKPELDKLIGEQWQLMDRPNLDESTESETPKLRYKLPRTTQVMVVPLALLDVEHVMRVTTTILDETIRHTSSAFRKDPRLTIERRESVCTIHQTLLARLEQASAEDIPTYHHDLVYALLNVLWSELDNRNHNQREKIRVVLAELLGVNAEDVSETHITAMIESLEQYELHDRRRWNRANKCIEFIPERLEQLTRLLADRESRHIDLPLRQYLDAGAPRMDDGAGGADAGGGGAADGAAAGRFAHYGIIIAPDKDPPETTVDCLRRLLAKHKPSNAEADADGAAAAAAAEEEVDADDAGAAGADAEVREPLTEEERLWIATTNERIYQLDSDWQLHLLGCRTSPILRALQTPTEEFEELAARVRNHPPKALLEVLGCNDKSNFEEALTEGTNRWSQYVGTGVVVLTPLDASTLDDLTQLNRVMRHLSMHTWKQQIQDEVLPLLDALEIIVSAEEVAADKDILIALQAKSVDEWNEEQDPLAITRLIESRTQQLQALCRATLLPELTRWENTLHVMQLTQAQESSLVIHLHPFYPDSTRHNNFLTLIGAAKAQLETILGKAPGELTQAERDDLITKLKKAKQLRYFRLKLTITTYFENSEGPLPQNLQSLTDEKTSARIKRCLSPNPSPLDEQDAAWLEEIHDHLLQKIELASTLKALTDLATSLVEQSNIQKSDLRRSCEPLLQTFGWEEILTDLNEEGGFAGEATVLHTFVNRLNRKIAEFSALPLRECSKKIEIQHKPFEQLSTAERIILRCEQIKARLITHSKLQKLYDELQSSFTEDERAVLSRMITEHAPIKRLAKLSAAQTAERPNQEQQAVLFGLNVLAKDITSSDFSGSLTSDQKNMLLSLFGNRQYFEKRTQIIRRKEEMQRKFRDEVQNELEQAIAAVEIGLGALDIDEEYNVPRKLRTLLPKLPETITRQSHPNFVENQRITLANLRQVAEKPWHELTTDEQTALATINESADRLAANAGLTSPGRPPR